MHCLRITKILRSIRFKFIFWYTLILTVTFSLFSIILYFNLNRSLQENLDDVLLSKAEGVAASINTYWETEKMDAMRRGVRSSVFSKINNANFIKIANRWVEERSNDPELVNIIVQIYKHDGEVIAYSKNSPFMARLHENILEHLRSGNNHFENQTIELGEDASLNVRILDIPIKENRKIAYIVQVSSPLTPLYTTLNRLKFLLFILLPLTVLITSVLAGEFLVSITLRPLKNMILTVRQITAENLQLRLSLPDTKDEIKQLAETFNDMLEKINRSFVSQKQFIQDVSHELRTPLTVLKGELEVALKRDRSADAYRCILQSNLEEIDKIHRILEDLLVLARLDSEDTTLKKEPADIVQFIRDIVGDVEILAQQKGITVSLHAGESVILDLDRERIRRVFFNILDNAIKFTPEHGNITLTLAKENHTIVIRVSDTGVGIPQEDLPFIFDRFYRADKSRSSEGFGLGLSITKSIIQAHKGAIACNSEPGRGTTFTISLPFGDLEGHS